MLEAHLIYNRLGNTKQLWLLTIGHWQDKKDIYLRSRYMKRGKRVRVQIPPVFCILICVHITWLAHMPCKAMTLRLIISIIWVQMWTQLSSEISGSATIKFDCPQLYICKNVMITWLWGPSLAQHSRYKSLDFAFFFLSHMFTEDNIEQHMVFLLCRFACWMMGH